MTLKKQFQVMFNNTVPNENRVDKSIKICDEFAIGFAEWFAQQPKVKVIKKIGLFNCYMKITSIELLEIYKKEKGL